MNGIDEEQLICAASGGDRDAFGRIVTVYQGLVFNTVRTKVRNEQDALDLSQEVFIKIWKSLPNWRGECKFSTWVYRVCVNAAFDFLRKSPHGITESLQTRVDEDGDEHTVEVPDESASSSPELTAEKHETSESVRSAIAKLTPEQREVVLLRDIEGYSYEEIAEMLSLEIGTVKSRLNRARSNLREMLKKEFFEKKSGNREQNQNLCV